MKILLIFVVLAGIALTAQPGVLACKYTCPNNQIPKARAGVQKIANGCGSKAFQVDSRILASASFLKCCNNHDYCYDTCNSVKTSCDSDFLKCMLMACPFALNFPQCITVAQGFYGAVMAFGCTPYTNAQKRVCYCP